MMATSQLSRPGKGAQVLLTISRICVTAWFGASLFFVSAVISLRGSALFDNDTKLNHPRVLFPLFYRFEFWLLGGALLCGLAAFRERRFRGTRLCVFLSLVTLALLTALADYVLVYRPLAEMLEQSTLPPEFALYHSLSRWINSAEVLLCGAASIVGLWPDGNETAGDQTG